MSSFKMFKLPEYVLEAVEKVGFKEPTIIQERVIPAVFSGKSIIGQSQTGTGKTHSFLLPIMAKINQEKMEVQAVITAPTRELAAQIYKAAVSLNEKFPEDKQIHIKSYVGGTDKQRSIDKLTVQPQLVIGTPGRIKDLSEENALSVFSADILVVDEADLMIDLGFMEDVDKIASRMAPKLQMLVFSATIPEKLQPFLKKYMNNPKHIHVDPTKVSVEKLEHILVPVRHRDKVQLVKSIIELQNPFLVLIFANTKQNADELADALLEKGLQVGRLHGNLPARERKRVMKEINALKYQYVVATDLAARGIDIEGVSHVINYELPQDLDFYIHRCGRTARAGMSGVAVTLYEEKDDQALNKLESMGVTFSNRDVVKGEWVEIDDRNKRKKRKNSPKAAGEVKNYGKFSKHLRKVKPGYKKKVKAEVEKIKKRERRLKKR
ncbi:DEAD/DEAH box helicase [Pradoshia sp. D12]|nr:DEAD/DEAH box helicase [Bacillus sp. FJAT-27986]QFK72218.1 DEAD/DEAH box helicase [Pradoshia sp. D12]TPF71289.1 DEAD/DEAH box helicase [Bacillus sp. D12]